jgi:arylsulfatase A-like enzyme
MSPRPLRGRAAACALLALLGCRRVEPPLPAEVRDLAELLPAARRVVETRALDIGEPAARERLWTGWGPDERDAERTYVWGLGERSVVTVDVVDARERRLVLRGWSYHFGDDPPQEVTVSVNGREVGRRLLPARTAQVEFDVPRAAWEVGENRIELAYRRHHAAAGELPWAVAWDGLRLTGAGERAAEVPAVDAEGALVLAAGTALDWGLELPGGAWLAWDAVESRAGAELEIEHVTDGETSVRTIATGGPGRLRLSDDDTPFRLHRLFVRAVSAASGRGDVRVRGLRLHRPPRPAVAERARPAAADPRPNLLVYVIDTLRADRLGCYGYPRPTSPEIDRFARGATLFSEGRAQSSWTRPAMATLLTGLLPIAHRAEDSTDRLPDEIETLAERLAAAGYATAMVTTNGNVVSRFGFRQGFETFRYLPERRRAEEVHVQSGRVNDVVFRWLATRPPDRPFFLVVHTCDPHDPYTPDRTWRRKLAPDVEDPSIGFVRTMLRRGRLAGGEGARLASAIGRLYDAEIAANDASFGALLRRLEGLGIAARTAVVLTSDHGEEFFEHGSWTHGRTLYEEQLRIPFIVRLPGGLGAGRVLPGPAEQIDLAPTLLELAGLPRPASLPGRSLVEDLEGPGPGPTRPSLAFLAHHDDRAASVVASEWKLIRLDRRESVLARSPVELYSLGSDPAERHSRILDRVIHRRWLEGLLATAELRYRSELPRESATIDRELAERLRALGYLR